MKGIILAGGTGSRLAPLTLVTNKHLLPVGRLPMILHAVAKLVSAGIDDIMVITGPEHMGAIVNLLGSGHDYDCNFTYRVQSEAGGIAQALGLCKNFVGLSDCCVILGDNIFEDDLKPLVWEFNAKREGDGTQYGAMVVLKSVEIEDAKRFGVAEIEADKIIGIQEKPAIPKSNKVVTGIYFYDFGVFNVIGQLKPSARNELEITDVNNDYIKRHQMYFAELSGRWTDAGTFSSLRYANEIMSK